MHAARHKLAKMFSKEKLVTAKSAMKRNIDLPLSEEMIEWLDDTIYERDEDGFGSEAVTSILAQPLDSHSLYCPVSAIISSKLSAPRVPSPVKKNISGRLSSDLVAYEKPGGNVGSSVQEAVDRMHFLWLQRKANFEKEEGNLEQSIKTLDEALDLHLGTKDYDKAKLSDRVISNSGVDLFENIQKNYFLYDKTAHRIASKLQNFYHRHHMKRGGYATLMSKTFRAYVARRNYRRWQDLRNQCARMIQLRFRIHLIRMNLLAKKIQTWWRLLGYINAYRRRLKIFRLARRIQRLWRGYKGRVRAYMKALELYMVKKIQRVIRGYQFRRKRGFFVMLYHKLFYRAALRIQCLARRIQAIRRSKNQLLYEIAREDGRLIREKQMIAETVQIEMKRTRMYLETEAGKLHFRDTVEMVKAKDLYFERIEPELTLSEKMAQHALVAFELFDTDGSGFIDEMKLKLLLQELCIPMNEQTLHRLFKEMDKFNTGEIDFNEFLDWYCSSNAANDANNQVISGSEDQQNKAASVFGDSVNMAKVLVSTNKPGDGKGKSGIIANISNAIYRSVEYMLLFRKMVSMASGVTVKRRAEREILRQTTQWLTRDSISGFRLSCPPKFQCCQCLKPFVLYTDYYMHFNQQTGYCQVVEEKSLFYQKYWLKNAWSKQRQCEYEIISLNNEFPKVEHYKRMAIYNELALQQYSRYANILKTYEGVAQRMYMHVLKPLENDLAEERAARRKAAEIAANEEKVSGTAASAFIGAISGTLKSFKRKKVEPPPPRVKTPAKGSKGAIKAKIGKGGKEVKTNSDKGNDASSEEQVGASGSNPSDAEAKAEKDDIDENEGAEQVPNDIENVDAVKEVVAGELPGLSTEQKPIIIIPLPPSMREVILRITDADLAKDKEVHCPQMIQCISKQLKCKHNVPIGWIASNKYLLSEIVDWLIDEVDERVALDRPFYVLTKRGKLKRDGLVLGKIHVYCTRIQQVAMEEALVTLLNSRLIRPRRITISDDELVSIGLPALTKRAYCDYNLSIVAKLDRMNTAFGKLYIPKPKHLLMPLVPDTFSPFNSIFSRNSLTSFDALRHASGDLGGKLRLVSTNSIIMAKRMFTWVFGSYMTYAQIGIMGAGDEVSEEITRDYLLEEYHARAEAKLSFRFRTTTGRAQLKRLAHELWATKRLIANSYMEVKDMSVDNIEYTESGPIINSTYIKQLLEYEHRDYSELPLLSRTFNYLTKRKTSLQFGVERVIHLRYMYELIASEFCASNRRGVDMIDFEMLENKLSLRLSETKKFELKSLLDPTNVSKLEFGNLAYWLYHSDVGVMNNLLKYMEVFSPTLLVKNLVFKFLLVMFGYTYNYDARTKLVCNQRILSRLEGDLRRLLAKAMHSDEYILNMGVFKAPPKKFGAQYKPKPVLAGSVELKSNATPPVLTITNDELNVDAPLTMQSPMDSYDTSNKLAIDSEDFIMKTQIDRMKDDDEQGELRVLYRQTADNAERTFYWNMLTGKNAYQVMTEALLIQASYDMIKTYSCCISPDANRPKLESNITVMRRQLAKAYHRARNAVLGHVSMEIIKDQIELEKYEVGWDLTLSVLIYTFDTDCTGNFDEGEIRLLLQCCNRGMSEKEILYYFPQVKTSSSTTEWITGYLARRVGWKLPLLSNVGSERDRGLLSLQTRNIYSTAVMSLVSLHRQIALEAAKTATTLAKTGKLLVEDDDAKDSGCLITRCQLLAVRQVEMFLQTLYGKLNRIILQEDEIESWWSSCVIGTGFTLKGMLSYACFIHSEKCARVLITEIPYVIALIMERFDVKRVGNMAVIADMVKTALAYPHKLVFIPIESVIRLLEPLFHLDYSIHSMEETEESFIPPKPLRRAWWHHRVSAVKLRKKDAVARMKSIARVQAIQIALNFPQLQVAETNFRCCILGLTKVMSGNISPSDQEVNTEARKDVRFSNFSSDLMLKEGSVLYLLSHGYTLDDLKYPELRSVIVPYHASGSFSHDTIAKEKVTFWGRRSESIHLSSSQKWDRWRRYFLYSAYYMHQYELFEKTLAENKAQIDVVAANYLKEIMTGVSHCANS